MNRLRFMQACLIGLLALLISSCTISPETQAKMDEYARTIPTCTSDQDCQEKWNAARTWVMENSDFAIRAESDTRIFSTTTSISQSGVGVIVDRVAVAGGGYQITVNVECFSAYGCPDVWAKKIYFNKTVNAAQL